MSKGEIDKIYDCILMVRSTYEGYHSITKGYYIHIIGSRYTNALVSEFYWFDSKEERKYYFDLIGSLIAPAK